MGWISRSASLDKQTWTRLDRIRQHMEEDTQLRAVLGRMTLSVALRAAVAEGLPLLEKRYGIEPPSERVDDGGKGRTPRPKRGRSR